MRPGPAAKTVKHGASNGAWRDIVNEPYTGPRPKLPTITGMHWFPQVEAWWEVFTTMPHCVMWEPSDWLAVVELAYLKNLWWAEVFGGGPSMAMATEIRRREDNMGGTVEARRKLFIRYVDPPTENVTQPETSADGEVVSIDKAASRRARLAG